MEAADGADAHAIIDVQFWSNFPGILGEFLRHISSPDGQCARSDFGITVGVSHREIGDAHTGGGAGAAVGEYEIAVLIVAAAGNGGDVDLIAVVLARVLKIDAGLERVIAPDLGYAIGGGIDGTRGVRGIGSARQTVEIVVQADSRNFSSDVFTGKQVRDK